MQAALWGNATVSTGFRSLTAIYEKLRPIAISSRTCRSSSIYHTRTFRNCSNSVRPVKRSKPSLSFGMIWKRFGRSSRTSRTGGLISCLTTVSSTGTGLCFERTLRSLLYLTQLDLRYVEEYQIVVLCPDADVRFISQLYTDLILVDFLLRTPCVSEVVFQ
jgi:hypothetical protein